MKTKALLKIILFALLGFMIWEIVDTSLESSLFKELSTLVQIPWMEATLYDFYTNVFCLSIGFSLKRKVMLRK